MQILRESFIGRIDETSMTSRLRIERTVDTQILRWLEAFPRISVTRRTAEHEVLTSKLPAPVQVYRYTVTIEYVLPAPDQSG